jgi:hypothetical protein
MTNYLSVLMMLPLFAACSGGSEPADAAADARVPAPPRTICDGTDNLRVMVAGVYPSGERFFAGHRVLVDNGSFILIDGHCRFWVKPSENKFEEVRSGVLDAATLAEFSRDLRYDYWPALQGSYPSDPSVHDMGNSVFIDRETSVTCVANCLLDSTPIDVVAMREAQTIWNARLWTAGAPVAGDLRVSAIISDLDTATWSAVWHPVPWPASIPIESLGLSETDGAALDYGDGVLLQGADADTLRVLRREFLRGDHGDFATIDNNAVISNGDGLLYFVNFRDTTPFEDAQGIISWLPR